ncbi:class I SAM-dependent methyltransferase [Streptomyces sp. NPDC002845]
MASMECWTPEAVPTRHGTVSPHSLVRTEYLERALPLVATAVSSSLGAYVHVAESLRAWPDPRALARRLQRAAWAEVAWRNVSGGVVVLQWGVKRR